MTKPIMLDIDGVLADFVAHFQAQAFAADGVIYPYAVTWNFALDQWGWSKDRFLGQMRANGENGFYRNVPAFEENVAAVAEFLATGGQVEFYTTRPDAAHSDTFEWLTDIFGADGWTLRMQSSGVKSDGERYAACLDDKDDNVLGLAEGCAHSYVLDRPWNAHLGHQRVYSVAEFLRIVTN